MQRSSLFIAPMEHTTAITRGGVMATFVIGVICGAVGMGLAWWAGAILFVFFGAILFVNSDTAPAAPVIAPTAQLPTYTDCPDTYTRTTRALGDLAAAVSTIELYARDPSTGRLSRVAVSDEPATWETERLEDA